MVRVQRNRSRQRAADELERLRHGATIRRSASALAALAARVRKDLVDEIAAARRRGQHVLRVPLPRRVLGRFVEEHFAVGDDSAEHVVEVVRDAARKASDRLHLLGLLQPLLQLHPLRLGRLALGDVLHHAEHAPGTAGLVARHSGALLYDPQLAVGTHQTAFDVEARTAFDSRRKHLRHACAVVRMDEVAQPSLPMRQAPVAPDRGCDRLHPRALCDRRRCRTPSTRHARCAALRRAWPRFRAGCGTPADW